MIAQTGPNLVVGYVLKNCEGLIESIVYDSIRKYSVSASGVERQKSCGIS